MKKETIPLIVKGERQVTLAKWFYILLIILILVLWLNLDSKSSALEEYKTCVNNCASDNEYCPSDYSEVSNNGFEYLALSDAEDCSTDLSTCIDFCDLD